MNDAAITIPCHLRTIRSQEFPAVRIHNGQVVANSEDVAAFFGKQHHNVLRDIRALIPNDNSCALNFEWTSRKVAMPSGGTRDVPTCDMTRDGFTLLAMGFTGKRALRWKLRYIGAFNAMEAELSKPRMVYDDPPPALAKRKAQPITELPSSDFLIGRVDEIDEGVYLLKTAEAALAADDYRDAETMFAVKCTIAKALKSIEAAREHLNEAA